MNVPHIMKYIPPLMKWTTNYWSCPVDDSILFAEYEFHMMTMDGLRVEQVKVIQPKPDPDSLP